MLSFDITDRNIRIIKGTESNGKIRISTAATLDLEEEVIVNGHVRDVPRLATLINQVLRTNKMPDKEAIVSVSSNMTIFKELHIQKAEKQQDFMKFVRAEMANALSIDDSYSVSYIIVGDSDQDANSVKVLATACPFEVVDCYKRVFNMLQISLRSVMIGCNCITKVLLADTKVKSKMPLLAVQIDPNFISLNLYENNQLSFSRFASISPEDYDDSDDYVFEAVKENIFRMLQFQRSKAGSDPIENVIFYGDTREFERLTNELEKMGIRTSVISVPPQIHGYENLEFSVYANAIGAMFKRNKETERINLLETDTVNNNRIRSDSSYVMLLILTIVISIAICAVVWLVLTIKNASVVSEKETIEAKQECQLTKDLNAQINMLTEKNKAVTSYLDGVTGAYQAFLSRPYPLAEKYELIENTIHNTIKSVFGDEVGADPTADHTEFYTIDNISYANGVYSLNLVMKGEDLPLNVLPSKIIEDLRSKSEIYYVAYNGYSMQEIKEEDDSKTSTPPAQTGEGDETQTDNPGTQTTTIQKDEKSKGKIKLSMPLVINMKGDGISLENEEE